MSLSLHILYVYLKFCDDTALHVSGFDSKEDSINLEHDSNLILEWSRDNYMTLSKAKAIHLSVVINIDVCLQTLVIRDYGKNILLY